MPDLAKVSRRKPLTRKNSNFLFQVRPFTLTPHLSFCLRQEARLWSLLLQKMVGLAQLIPFDAPTAAAASKGWRTTSEATSTALLTCPIVIVQESRYKSSSTSSALGISRWSLHYPMSPMVMVSLAFFQTSCRSPQVVRIAPYIYHNLLTLLLPSHVADPAIPMAHQEKERTPFLRFMKWDEHMADIRMSEAKRTSIIQLKAPARPDEMGYCTLGSVVHDYILRGMDIGWNHNNQSRVRKHLAQGANLSPNAYVDFIIFKCNALTAVFVTVFMINGCP